jgi:PadR family transcriptional regulator PadR
MTTPAYLGEFEHLLLLAVLQLGDTAFGADIARELEQRAGRSVSRGHLYTSLDRLEAYTLTPAGIAALRATRDTLRRMWRGLDAVLNEPAS